MAMPPIPSLSGTGGAAGPAISGGGAVYHGDIKTGMNAFAVIGIVILTFALAFKLGKKL